VNQARPAGAPVEQPLNFVTFWSILGKLAVGWMRQRAHGEIIVTFHDGNIPLVRVHRAYKPQNLPDV
jgi:hypothetical protein